MRSVCRIGGFVAGAMLAALPRGAEAATPAHLGWAQSLVDTIKPAANDYGDPAQISWKGSNGLAHSTNRTKCASLVTQLLEKAYDPDFVGWFGCTSPHAAAYHDAIEVEDGFDLIESILDIQPGDIVAIRYDDAGCSQLTCGTFTGCTTSGHVAIVAAAPTLRSPVSPLVAGTIQYALPIIDSSSTYHGVTDTRYKSDALGADDRGVGRGTMRLYVDSADPERPIVGYSWSNVAGSLFYPHSKRDLVIGRYRP
jgi:hypothetical protein